jgi:hypothetical protein
VDWGTKMAISNQDRAHGVGSIPPTTQCVVCKEDIRPNAEVCTKCKSPQNWTRYIFSWKDIGSATLALLPLWTGAYALWNIAFKEPVVQLQLAAPICQKTRVVLAIANYGDAMAILSIPRLNVLNDPNPLKPFDLRPISDYPYLVDAKRSFQVTLTPQIGGLVSPLPTPNSSNPHACSIVIEVPFTGFKGRGDLAKAKCDCPQES